MFDSLKLLDFNLTPKALCAIYVQVTGQTGTLDHVHKNNLDNVMVLDEFLEMMSDHDSDNGDGAEAQGGGHSTSKRPRPRPSTATAVRSRPAGGATRCA